MIDIVIINQIHFKDIKLSEISSLKVDFNIPATDFSSIIKRWLRFAILNKSKKHVRNKLLKSILKMFQKSRAKLLVCYWLSVIERSQNWQWGLIQWDRVENNSVANITLSSHSRLPCAVKTYNRHKNAALIDASMSTSCLEVFILLWYIQRPSYQISTVCINRIINQLNQSKHQLDWVQTLVNHLSQAS